MTDEKKPRKTSKDRPSPEGEAVYRSLFRLHREFDETCAMICRTPGGRAHRKSLEHIGECIDQLHADMATLRDSLGKPELTREQMVEFGAPVRILSGGGKGGGEG